MSAVLTGLPLYDEAMRQLEADSSQAEATLAARDLTLEQAVRIAHQFEAAERGFAALRCRAERAGLRLYREMIREAAV